MDTDTDTGMGMDTDMGMGMDTSRKNPKERIMALPRFLKAHSSKPSNRPS